MIFLTLLPVQVFGWNSWEYGGLLEESAQVFARRPNLSDAYASAAGHFQIWSRAAAGSRLSFRGTLDVWLDTHHNVNRRSWLEMEERRLRRPAGTLSELYMDLKLGPVDLRVGKQQIRWGRADGFNPTDNLAPYDFLDIFSGRRIAVPAVKADVYFGRTRFEGVWAPFYTPSRLPLPGRRWFPRLPAKVQALPATEAYAGELELLYRDLGGSFPPRTAGNGQWGVRYNRIVPRAEFSFSYFEGFDDVAFFRTSIAPVPLQPRAVVAFSREYHRIRVAGADFASEFGSFGIRGEAAYFDRSDPDNLDHLLFVFGVDKTWGDWFAGVQYAGRKVSKRIPNGLMFPDLALRSTMLCRIERMFGVSRSIEIKAALRLRDGDLFVQPLYSIALSNNWRLKIGAAVFMGAAGSYLGQYRDSSHGTLELIRSF